MPENVEIKARIASREFINSFSDAPSKILHQTDTYFSVPAGRLKIREFNNRSAELIYYRRPDSAQPSVSTYYRQELFHPEYYGLLLQSLYPVRGVIRKVRQVFLFGHTRIHLDRVESLGDFLELEVVLDSEQTITDGNLIAQNLLTQLQIPEETLLSESYIDLLERKKSRGHQSNYQ